MNFHQRLIELKQSKKVLQKDIAAAIGVTVRNYQRYEKGEQQPTLNRLVALADFFDVSLDYLCGRTDDLATQTYSTNTNANIYVKQKPSLYSPDDNDILLSKCLELDQNDKKVVLATTNALLDSKKYSTVRKKRL